MYYLSLSIYIILIFLLIVFNIVVYHSLISSRFGKYPPFVPTNKHRKKVILLKIRKIIKNSNKQIAFLDAGSGTGTIIIPLAKKFPQDKFVGIEWGKLPYLFSKIKSCNLKNLKLIQNNMLLEDFSKFDIIYCYIVKNFMKELENKIIKECRPGTVVICNGDSFNKLDTIEEVKVDNLINSQSIFIQKVK